MEDYDYSHLMEEILNMENQMEEVPNPENEDRNLLDTTDLNIQSPTGNIDGLPEAEKVLHEIPSVPTYSGDVFGRVKFICKLSLAINEVAVVHIPSRLQRSTISSK